MSETGWSSNSKSEGRVMHSGTAEPLKLLALDNDDLKILSAHLQDAVLRMTDMAYLPAEKRFAAILSRFDWLAAEKGDGKHSNLRRCRCALRFDRVIRAQVQKVRPGDTYACAELLAITFEETDPPAGFITLYFAGEGAVRLQVECVEAELSDLGDTWRAAVKPEHSICDAEVLPAGAGFFQGQK
jgi:Protein of unknown function (DUF2948)